MRTYTIEQTRDAKPTFYLRDQYGNATGKVYATVTGALKGLAALERGGAGRRHDDMYCAHGHTGSMVSACDREGARMVGEWWYCKDHADMIDHMRDYMRAEDEAEQAAYGQARNEHLHRHPEDAGRLPEWVDWAALYELQAERNPERLEG